MGEPDLSAFWLYPDWDGPLKQPFWMRPLKVPGISGPDAEYIDFGAVDFEAKAMTRVACDPEVGQYAIVDGSYIARTNRPWMAHRARRKADGSLCNFEILRFNS